MRLLGDEPIRRFLGRPKPKYKLDPDAPLTFGAIATPDTYYEFRMQQAEAMKNALHVFEEVEMEFESFSGRRYGAVDAYNTEKADVVMVINGSAAGTMRAAARLLNAAGENVGVLAIKLYRPFPVEQLVSNLAHAKAVIVMDRSLSPGAPSGPLSEDTKSAMHLAGLTKPILSVVYGIGGRDLSTEDGKNIFGMAKEGSAYAESTVMYGVKV